MFFSFVRIKNKESGGKKRRILLIAVVAVSVAMWVAVLSVLLVYAFRKPDDTAFCEGAGECSLLAESREDREAFFRQFGFEAELVSFAGVKVPQEIPVKEEGGCLLVPLQGGFTGLEGVRYIFELRGKQGVYSGVMLTREGRVIAAYAFPANREKTDAA